MVDTVNGKLRVRRWPRKRGKPKTEGEKRTQKEFASMQRATKYFAPRLYADLAACVEGTPLLPRDIMTMMLSGRLCAFILEDGKTRWPLQARLDVSEALDALGNTPGFFLFRTETMWEALPLPAIAIRAALVSRVTNFDIGTDTWTAIPQTAVEYDDLGFFNPAQPTRLTVPPGVGRVRLTGQIRYVSAANQAIAAIAKNGVLGAVEAPGLPAADTETAGGDYLNVASAIVSVVEGDYFELAGYHSGNGDVERAWLQIETVA